VRGFFTHLLSTSRGVPVDVYALMFLCDFFNFLVIVFGFSSFGVSLYVYIYPLSYVTVNFQVIVSDIIERLVILSVAIWRNHTLPAVKNSNLP
jgi:hypothetical protein